MDLVSTIIDSATVAVVGVLVAAFLNGRTKELKVGLKDVGTELKADIAEVKLEVKDLRAEMNERFRDQGRETASLRSDVTQLALALRSQPHPQAG
jgi:hypothetical protein